MIRLKSSLVLGTFSVIILCQLVTCDNDEGFFSVVGSNLLKFRDKYRVSVVYQGFKNEKKLQIGVKSTEKKNDDVSWIFFCCCYLIFSGLVAEVADLV